MVSRITRFWYPIGNAGRWTDGSPSEIVRIFSTVHSSARTNGSEFFDDWGTGVGIKSGYHRDDAMFGLWSVVAEGRFALCDVIGRLEAAKAFGSEAFKKGDDVFKAQEKSDCIKLGSYDHMAFLLPQSHSQPKR